MLTVFLVSAALIACQEKDYNAANLELDGLCVDINNSYKCAQKIERLQLKNFPDKVRRDGGTLRINLRNGQMITLKDPEAEIPDGEWYSFRHYYETLGYFLIEIQYYEGGAYMLINNRSGDKYVIDDLPIISPNGHKFVAASGDLAAQYDPNRIQIYRFTPEGITLEWSIEPANWEPYGATWLDDKTIELHDSFGENTKARILRKTNSSWQIND